MSSTEFRRCLKSDGLLRNRRFLRDVHQCSSEALASLVSTLKGRDYIENKSLLNDSHF